MALSQGNYVQVEQYLQGLGVSDLVMPAPGLEPALIIRLRLAAVLGEVDSDRIPALLQDLRNRASSQGDATVFITACVLQGQWAELLGRMDEANQFCLDGLQFAHDKGYFQTVVDLCHWVHPEFESVLLRLAGQRHLHTSFRLWLQSVRNALDAEGSEQPSLTGSETTSAVVLVEPLTPREEEVLVLLARGLSNQAIADTLYLSRGTVKWHTINIYGKLGVNSRTQAVSQARNWLLLS